MYVVCSVLTKVDVVSWSLVTVMHSMIVYSYTLAEGVCKRTRTEGRGRHERCEDQWSHCCNV